MDMVSYFYLPEDYTNFIQHFVIHWKYKISSMILEATAFAEGSRKPINPCFSDLACSGDAQIIVGGRGDILSNSSNSLNIQVRYYILKMYRRVGAAFTGGYI